MLAEELEKITNESKVKSIRSILDCKIEEIFNFISDKCKIAAANEYDTLEIKITHQPQLSQKATENLKNNQVIINLDGKEFTINRIMYITYRLSERLSDEGLNGVVVPVSKEVITFINLLSKGDDEKIIEIFKNQYKNDIDIDIAGDIFEMNISWS